MLDHRYRGGVFLIAVAVMDDGNDFHLGCTDATYERICFVDHRQESCPRLCMIPTEPGSRRPGKAAVYPRITVASFSCQVLLVGS